MKISEIITDKYKLRIPPTVYYELLADVIEAEEKQEPCNTDTCKVVKAYMNEWDKPITAEPKTGHWIEKDGFDGDVYYDCSECGESWTTIEGTPWDNEWDYCPSCGARMESEE